MSDDIFVVAVDLDGVILEFDGWDGGSFGEVRPGAAKGLKKLRELGCFVVVWTCRADVDSVEEVLDGNGLIYDTVNSNRYGPNGVGRKIYADVYIDDRNLDPVTDWDMIVEKVEKKVKG